MAETVLYDVADGVATITLNRPEVLNAMNDEMGAQLLAALRRAERDEAVGALVLTGAGRAFCSGEDMRAQSERLGAREAGRAEAESGLGRILRERYNPIVERIWDCEKPVVAAVNGVAAGAGASLALACDLRIAGPRAGLVLAFVQVGLVPDSGANWFLPRMIGLSRALEIALSGRRVDAEECRELGLFHRVVADEELPASAREAALRLAEGPYSVRLIRRALRFGAGHSLADTLEYEAELQEMAGRTADHLEGMRAFLEKRPAAFTRRPPGA
ncbi:MAG: enoyl-CoA hydratase/isomerase family protein [Clostridia bacterium]|nr:enoyl-CoA hydratase/isomerase family protein [Clostridia bacterium]